MAQAGAEGKGETSTRASPNFMLGCRYLNWVNPLAGEHRIQSNGLRPILRLKPRMLSIKPRTLVDQSADLIIDAASEGVFLPGDRLVEADIARQIGISRVPVREAMRLLES